MCCLQAKPFLDPHGEMPTSRGGSLMMRAICFCHSPGPGEPWGGEWHSANQDVFTRRFPCQTPGPAPGIRCVEERNGFHSLAACCPAGRPVSYVEAIFSPAFLPSEPMRWVQPNTEGSWERGGGMPWQRVGGRVSMGETGVFWSFQALAELPRLPGRFVPHWHGPGLWGPSAHQAQRRRA